MPDIWDRWCKTCEAHGDLIPATGSDGQCDDCREDGSNGREVPDA